MFPLFDKRRFLRDHRKVDAVRGDEEHQRADVDINAIFENVGEGGNSAGTIVCGSVGVVWTGLDKKRGATRDANFPIQRVSETRVVVPVA